MLEITVDGQKFTYDPRDLLNTEAKTIQAHSGLTVDEWYAAIDNRDMTALDCLVWVLRSRAGDETPIGEAEYKPYRIEIVDPEAEKAEAEADPTPTTSPESPPEPQLPIHAVS